MSTYKFADPDIGQTKEIQLPITINLDINDALNDLKVQPFVSVDSFTMRKTIAVLWVSRMLDESGKESNGAGPTPITISLFGGIAFRFHCPSMNDPRNPLHRTPNDVDYAILKEDGARFTAILQQMDSGFGSALTHWTFHRDRVFNGFRRGTRYRMRCVTGVDEAGAPIPGVTDIICDNLSFCHEIPLRDAIVRARENSYTIGLERMILSKAQFIKRAPRDQLAEEAKPRLLENFGANEVVLGMEPKDMKDVTGAFIDHELGKGPEKINVDIIGEILQRNWGLRKTVLLNLNNINRVLSTNYLGLEKEKAKMAIERIQVVIDTANEKYIAKRPRFNFSSEWWEAVDEGRT